MSAGLPLAVTCEDRPEALAGVELLARSLARHAPGMRIRVHSPCAGTASRLAGLPGAEWRPAPAGAGWDVKPGLLLAALEDEERAVWIDGDIVAAGDLAGLLGRFPPEEVVVSEDHPRGGAFESRRRAEAFGLAWRRTLPECTNSGVVMVSRRHRDLLRAWKALLAHPDYRAAQALPADARPAWFFGDQDALWALLASAPFDTLPVRWLKRGREIVLSRGAAGFGVGERLACLAGARPALVHMLGPRKPWSFAEVPPPFRRPGAWLQLVAYEVSPVLAAARPDAAALGNPPWLARRTLPGRLLNGLARGNPALAGLPLALLAAAAAGLRRFGRRFGRRPRRR